MTDFTNLAALVAQGQELLDLIKGGKIAEINTAFINKLAEVDGDLANAIAQANSAVAAATAPIDGKIPRIQLSLNQELVTSSGSVPDGMVVWGGGAVTVAHHALVPSDKTTRSAEILTLLSEMQTGIREQFADFNIRSAEYYRRAFNVVQIDWDFGADFGGYDALFSMYARAAGSGNAYDIVSEMTGAAMVKLLSGSVGGAYGTGAELGKWRFCSTQFVTEHFGYYNNLNGTTTSQKGSMLLALPVFTTGVIAHPKQLFKNIEL